MSKYNRRNFIKSASTVGGIGILAGAHTVNSATTSHSNITTAELASGITSVHEEYCPGDVRRYLTSNDLSSYKTGELTRYKEYSSENANDQDVRYALQAAHDQGNQIGGARPYLPGGGWVISAPIHPCQLGMHGESSLNSVIRCNGCDAFVIQGHIKWNGRPARVFEKFGIDSLHGDLCKDKWGFRFESAAENKIGFTVRDMEIGINGPFGGGFYLTNLYRAHIENVGMTDISCMVQIVGQVVQATFRNVMSNNDNPAPSSVIKPYGINIQERDGIVCENIVFENCAYIGGEIGIHHIAGVHIEFLNFDTETTKYGALIEAECYMHGGIMGCSKYANEWTGIKRIKRENSGISVPHDGTIFDSVDVNALNQPRIPNSSYGFDFGDDNGRMIHGVVIKNCRIRGHVASFTDGIRGRHLREATIEDNFFRSDCFTGRAMNIDGRRLHVNKNSCPGEVIEIQDGNRNDNACGEIKYNDCRTLTTNFSNLTRWTIVDL